MANEGISEANTVSELAAKEKKGRASQPNQTRKKVISKPMNQHDLSVARNRLATGSAKVGHDTGVRGPVNHQATILNQLNSEQISAVRENPDLNRKLRVDRIKRLALYDANYNQ